MDPALSSLFPIHQIGSDGFAWWIGQVESNKGEDPKNSGRYRVRIVGQHLKDCDATPTDQLPWANVMMPVTTPWSDGGVTGATIDLRQGNWVMGCYLDNDRQKPLIMGSIGHTAGATKKENVEKDPSPGETCKSFTTFLSPNINPQLHKAMPSSEKRNGDSPAQSTTAENTGTTDVGEAGQIAAAVKDRMPPAFYGLFAEASTTNPTGNKVCVEIANPNCGSENDLKGGLTNIIGEMLKATQQSGGNLGTFYVSKINGELNNYIDHGMQYVNKAVRLVKSFVARVKGEIVKLIREGVDKLVELVLYTKVAEEAVEEGEEAAEPSQIDQVEEAEEPATKKESRLKPILDVINDVLDDLGCSMADLTEQLAQWLTDLLLGYLMDAFSNAACLVDNVVNGIINQILAFIDNLLQNVLGPLQEILALLAAPLDIIGNAINKVLSLLGISCDGPGTQCEKVTKECTDCSTGENEDWLDKLIDAIEGGATDNSTYVCDEAKNTSVLDNLPDTSIDFVGGTRPNPSTTDPDSGSGVPGETLIRYSSADIEVTEGEQAIFVITRSGNVTTASSVTVSVYPGTATEGTDFARISSGSSIGFAPGETTKQIVFETYRDSQTEGPEEFQIRLAENVTPEGYVTSFGGSSAYSTAYTCTILDYTTESLSPPSGSGPSAPYSPPSRTTVNPIQVRPVTGSITPPRPVFSVTTDQIYYSEGDTIRYRITTQNVTNPGPYTYTLDGDIDANDIASGNLTGNFTLDTNGNATIDIQLAVNDDVEEVLDDEGNVVNNGVDPIENITFYIDNTPAYASAFILADNDPLVTDAAWFVTSDVNYVREGETVTFTVTTRNIPDGTNFTYALVGNVDRTDIVGYRLESSVDFNAVPLQIVNGQCVIPITIAGDRIIETTPEYFDFTIRSYIDAEGNTQTVENVSSQVIILPDTDGDVDGDGTTPSFVVSTDKLTYDEGETIVYTIRTSNVPNGTVLQYTLYGDGINRSDFINDSLFGSFTIINDRATVYIGISEDLEIEVPETVTFIINGTGASADVIINDTTADRLRDQELIGLRPCYDRPIAGAPITDESGAIISIPIISRGCPYALPPRVIISGAGYGASAIPLLDSNGNVTEIRVTRSGRGYRRKLASDFDLRCVIDSYTIINPGVGYTTAPEVYVDGEAGRAEAIIDERGYVISVQPTDRTSTWNEIPAIQIIGGGGSGARVLPSVTCLDTNEYEEQGYAKIGTGRYIDCP
jgi:hypothetical protein